jgi:heptosyltransferase-2
VTPYHSIHVLVILAPNWLGDAVMALPAIADVRRAAPGTRIAIAARPTVAPLFALVPDVDDVVVLRRNGWRGLGADLSGKGFEAALLLPNSLHAALSVSRAGVPERWGYRTDLRGPLLTRAIAPPSGLHQVEYYQQLVHALDCLNGSTTPRVAVPPAAREAGAALLRQSGWDGRAPIVALAPGAAYGGAKRWLPASFAALAGALARDGVRSVMVGSAADAATAAEVAQAAPAIGNLVGQTDLSTLAGLLTHCRTLVTNDSGAMHLAAAAGVAVTAVFGPTDERVTRPIGDAHAIITGAAWCRPCLLRECPLDHRCMTGIDVPSVVAATSRTL